MCTLWIDVILCLGVSWGKWLLKYISVLLFLGDISLTLTSWCVVSDIFLNCAQKLPNEGAIVGKPQSIITLTIPWALRMGALEVSRLDACLMLPPWWKLLFLLCSADDFESKYSFHPVEDFPAPEEFKHFQRIYPSKTNRGKCWFSSVQGHTNNL